MSAGPSAEKSCFKCPSHPQTQNISCQGELQAAWADKDWRSRCRLSGSVSEYDAVAVFTAGIAACESQFVVLGQVDGLPSCDSRRIASDLVRGFGARPNNCGSS